MRKNPSTSLDGPVAIISWTRVDATREGTFAIFHTDQQRLLADYQRSGMWSPIPGARSSAWSLYLEKSTCGHAWFHFGRRHYIPGRNGRSNIVEPNDQRIEVRVLTGGKNRPRVEKNVRMCTALWVVFACYDGNDPEGLVEAARDLRAGCLGAALGTEPIRLNGIFSRGKLIRTRKEVYKTIELC